MKGGGGGGLQLDLGNVPYTFTVIVQSEDTTEHRLHHPPPPPWTQGMC